MFVEYFLCLRHVPKPSAFSHQPHEAGHYLHLTDEETETPHGSVTCSRAHRAGQRSRRTWDSAQSLCWPYPGEGLQENGVTVATLRLSEVPHSDLSNGPSALWHHGFDTGSSGPLSASRVVLRHEPLRNLEPHPDPNLQTHLWSHPGWWLIHLGNLFLSE